MLNFAGKRMFASSARPKPPNAASLATPASPWTPDGTTTLRRRFSLSMKGATLGALAAAANALDVSISTAVLRPEEVAAAVKVQEPVYRVVATLEQANILAYGHTLPLQSGMALQADILLEARSFLDLLLDPVRAAKGRILG